jgi:transcriptional regulator with GAF, ATPase, and Fis domain
MSPRTKSVRGNPRLGTSGPRSTGRLQRAIDATVRKEIQAALRETTGNVAAAARLLGVTEMAIRKRLRSLQIDPNRFR